MAFESVDVTSLRNSINSCKASLNHSASQNLITSLSSSIWQAGAKQVLINALDKLNNERYKKLEDTLDTYLTIADKIQNYKNLEQQNRNLRNEISSLQGRLWYTEYYTEYYTDYLGRTYSEEHSRRVKDYGVENQINNNYSRINSNNNTMERLKNEVSNLI